MSTPTAQQRSRVVFASSLAIDVATMALVPAADSIAAETAVVFDRITAQLSAQGLGLADVVRITAYLRDESYLAEFETALHGRLAGDVPLSVAVLGLAGNCRVQVEAVALRS